MISGNLLIPDFHFKSANFHISKLGFIHCLSVLSNKPIVSIKPSSNICIKSVLKVQSCQGNEFNDHFLFRWITPTHILHVSSHKCLQGFIYI